jgi:hypothetical protein
MISREFDHAGRMVAMTDAAGRQTEYRLNVGPAMWIPL